MTLANGISECLLPCLNIRLIGFSNVFLLLPFQYDPTLNRSHSLLFLYFNYFWVLLENIIKLFFQNIINTYISHFPVSLNAARQFFFLVFNLYLNPYHISIACYVFLFIFSFSVLGLVGGTSKENRATLGSTLGFL